MTDQVTTLFRQEVELAKVEVKREASRAGRAGAQLGAGGVVGHVALLLLGMAAAWGLAELIPVGLAFLVVAVVFAIVAWALISAGRRRLQDVNPRPEQTIETLKEDKQWLKDRRT
jgi:membrane protein implicated in regulation of membrane protease activity